jgi:hypothetical protein
VCAVDTGHRFEGSGFTDLIEGWRGSKTMFVTSTTRKRARLWQTGLVGMLSAVGALVTTPADAGITCTQIERSGRKTVHAGSETQERFHSRQSYAAFFLCLRTISLPAHEPLAV